LTQRFASLDDPDFGRLFTTFSYTAYRLETHQIYDVSYEDDSFKRFLAGGSRGDFPSIKPWADQVSDGVAAGKRFQRVHIILEPLTDYIRFECAWSYRDAVAAGEDVRVIPAASESDQLDLPEADYWLFDSSLLLRMMYTSDGGFDYAELVGDPDEIVRANFWRDRALHLSVPFSEYEEPFDEFMRKQERG
jgi:hypothetical protein